MGQFVNHKLIERTEGTDNYILDRENNRACDFEFDDTGVFLNIKCFNGHESKRYRNIRICLTDIIVQVLGKLTADQKRVVIPQIENAISK